MSNGSQKSIGSYRYGVARGRCYRALLGVVLSDPIASGFKSERAKRLSQPAPLAAKLRLSHWNLRHGKGNAFSRCPDHSTPLGRVGVSAA